MVKRPDVEGVDLPSAQTVIFIPRARPCSETPFSLQRHPTACTSRLQETSSPYRIPFIDMVRRSL